VFLFAAKLAFPCGPARSRRLGRRLAVYELSARCVSGGRIYLITTTSTPRSRSPQTLSAVTTRYPSCSPRARQARSPSDKPARRLVVRSRAAMRAWGSSKGTTRKSIADTAALVCASFRPSSCSLVRTSQTLTALDGRADKAARIDIIESFALQRRKYGRGVRDNISLIHAPPVRAVRQSAQRPSSGPNRGGPRFAGPRAVLAPGYADATPVSDRLHNQLIARLQAGGRAALSRDHNPALLVDACSAMHVIVVLCVRD
jgi:hypothetical protein